MLSLRSGKLQMSFRTLAEAAEYVQKKFGVRITGTGIAAVCRGTGKSAARKFWRWAGSDNLPRVKVGGARDKVVEKVCLETGRVVQQFRSAVHAADQMGESVSTMCRVCREGQQRSGFLWRYAEEEDTGFSDLGRAGGQGTCKKRKRAANDDVGPEERLVGKQLRVYRKTEDVWYIGTVKGFDAENGTHTVLYDDGDEQQLDLSEEAHAVLGGRSVMHGNAKEGGRVATKDAGAEAREGEGRRKEKKNRKEGAQEDAEEARPRREAAEAVLMEAGDECPICLADPMSKPASTACNHVFCEACILEHLRHCIAVRKSTPRCPYCNAELGSDPVITLKEAETEQSACFRKVEQLSLDTGKVLAVFPSASAASRRIPGTRAYVILQVCLGEKGVKSEGGFLWRFLGSDTRRALLGERNCDGRAVEQIDLLSGEVIAEFRSTREALARTGVARVAIRRVCEGQGKNASAGGFFWRYKGNTQQPWPPRANKQCKPVEQLDFASGAVMREFASLSEARAEFGKGVSIAKVCDDGFGSAAGFFWRWKGSANTPRRYRDEREGKAGKKVQQLTADGKRVLREFATATAAAELVGSDLSLARACREGTEQGGFRWRYVSTERADKPKTIGPEAVGRRLKVWRSTEEGYREAMVEAFDVETALHRVRYQGGEEEEDLDLAVAEIRWTARVTKAGPGGNGEIAVEKISLEDGSVLASYPSVSEAARAHQVGVSHLSGVLRGRQPTCGGFFWRYLGSDAVAPRRKHVKEFEQLCLETGAVLARYPSVAAAAKAVNISAPSISNICNGWRGHKSAGGFGWRFAAPT